MYIGLHAQYPLSIIMIIISHELGLDIPFRLRLLASSKVFRVILVHLVYKSALFVISCCCSFLLRVVASLFCIILVSLHLVLLSPLPKFLRSFVVKKEVPSCFSEKKKISIPLSLSDFNET